MASYFQMGHQMENLVGATDLDSFGGIILSPVNRTQIELTTDVSSYRDMGSFDILFDPQLYVPNSSRERLIEQSYFPNDFDTADYSSIGSWSQTMNDIVEYAISIHADGVCSPVRIPNSFADGFYTTSVELGNLLQRTARADMRTFCTIIVDIRMFENTAYVLNLASILQNVDTTGYYFVIRSEGTPRIEINNTLQLSLLMYLVNLLSENTEKEIIVSHCSSDVLLYKYAGATHCASGKFFNLRRFTTSRYEETSGGGGQTAYWFEQSLLAFLRDNDLRRLQNRNFNHLIATGFSNNHWSNEIFTKMANSSPWLGDSWRQFLCWFSRTENYFSNPANRLEIVNWITNAENNWTSLRNAPLSFDEETNDGRWVRSWRLAIEDFNSYIAIP